MKRHSRPSTTWAYPRIRGGTRLRRWSCCPPMGLSPHTRGNRVGNRLGLRGVGPIPAYAGEPIYLAARLPLLWAYPRIRGGTWAMRRSRPTTPGLSPHTRGNQIAAQIPEHIKGPIPAYAGEPADQEGTRPRGRAYPRIRGGTRLSGKGRVDLGGLSPHTRGNPSHRPAAGRMRGPIPAYAGEPQRSQIRLA